MAAESAEPSIAADLLRAHAHCGDHRSEVLASSVCGCFACCEMFPSAAIRDWTCVVDDVGHTALCPCCGLDSVLGESTDYDLTPGLLLRMNQTWF